MTGRIRRNAQLEVLGIPLLLGGPSGTDMYASYLYKAWTNGFTPDPPYVSAGALLLLLAVTALLVLRALLIGSERHVGGGGVRGGRAARPMALRAWRLPLALLTGAYIALTTGVTVVLVAVATLIANRSQFPLRSFLGPALVYPRSVPGIVLGIGFFWAFLFADLPGGVFRNSILSELVA
ncbi:MAG TPA: hypothetical protein VF160_05710, partial [Candidatus Dormibacteraeota bacterium]